MIKDLQTIIPAGFRKMVLVTALAFVGNLNSFGQDLKTGISERPLFSTQDVSQILKTGFGGVKKANPANQPVTQNARVAVQHLPLNSQIFSPDAAKTGWILKENGRYTYDTLGNQTSLTRIPVAPYPALKDSSLYDAQGNQTFHADFSRSPSGGIWNMHNGYRKQYMYNVAGQPNEIIREDYNSLGWGKTGREIFAYNAAGYVSEKTIYNWQNNSWVPYMKFTYGFAVSTNPPSSITVQNYNGSSWVNQFRFQNLTWHNFAQDQYLTREEQTWTANAWSPVSKSTVVYDPFGGSVNVSQTFNGLTWANSGRSTITKNSHSHIIGLKYESWHNNGWVISDERQFILTYNAANQLTEEIYRNWDSMSSTLKNASRITYSNFLVMGTPKALTALTVQVYPNPVTDLLHIQLAEAGNMQAVLSDLTGKVVLSQNLPAASNHELNLSPLAKGTYLLRLETKKGNSLQKIVKQ